MSSCSSSLLFSSFLYFSISLSCQSIFLGCGARKLVALRVACRLIAAAVGDVVLVGPADGAAAAVGNVGPVGLDDVAAVVLVAAVAENDFVPVVLLTLLWP